MQLPVEHGIASRLAFSFLLTFSVLACWLALLPVHAQEDFEPVPEVEEEGAEESEGETEPVEGEPVPAESTDDMEPVEGEVVEPEAGQDVEEGEEVEGDVPVEGDEPAEEETPPPDPVLEKAKLRLQKIREKTASLKKPGVEQPGSTRITTGSSRRVPPRTTSPKKGSVRTATPKGEAKAKKDVKEAEAEPEGLVAQVKTFFTEHQNWVIGALSVGLLGSLAYLFLGSRRRRREDDDESIDLVPLGHLNVEEEDDGPRRVLIDPKTGKPQKVSNKDDSEYALVVDEDELQIQQGHIERLIDKLVDDRDYEKAYERYREYQLDESAHLKPQARSERLLAHHFLEAGEFDKAKNVLEHHVLTRPDPEIDPKVFFDLAYISFKRKTLNKSRQYFQTYATREPDSRLTERARRVLKQLERVQNLN